MGTASYIRLKKTTDLVRKYKMTLEMEFDNRLFSDKDYLNKFYDYLDEYGKEGAWAIDR